MPPFLALVVGYALIAWLIRTDLRHRTAGSFALWIPGLWIFAVGARPLPFWLEQIGIGSGGNASNTESDPINTLTYSILIAAAFVVLLRRKFDWPLLVGRNKALIALYLFFAVSSLWSPEPFITFRRLVKDFGGLVVALVILTEPRPWFACRVLFYRVSCIFLTLSLVVSKYYPDIGRYSFRSGDTSYTGLTQHKNTLGEAVLIFSLFLVWDLMEIPTELAGRDLRLAKWLRYLVLAIGIWLMVMSDSATAQICLLLGSFLFFAFRKLAKMARGRRLFRIALAATLLLALADKMLGISGAVAEMFGRNMTLTGRTEIWDVTLSHQEHPIIGFGYYAFWDTPIAFSIYEEAGDLIHIKTVHNGYLEIFLSGGYVGLAFLGFFLISTWRTAYGRLFDFLPSAALPLVMWIVDLIYNNSESSFLHLGFLWFTFLVISTNYALQNVHWTPNDFDPPAANPQLA